MYRKIEIEFVSFPVFHRAFQLVEQQAKIQTTGGGGLVRRERSGRRVFCCVVLSRVGLGCFSLGHVGLGHVMLGCPV